MNTPPETISAILDPFEARDVAKAVRTEAERRSHPSTSDEDYLPVEEYVGWIEAADFIEGVERDH